ncbi:hypothetical protein CgunFtcFv8_010035 [Champsocephalus gunnari]|uniref:Beta-1,4-galactosyltransferase n=1 Tax=Champsocephalus gunnari TaxID=52237 RepID=A0AAN8E000_CHAGU|nr:hypothetical protein CgunFtcFv8_010035 [Champsocephalus gunnari]
MAGDFSLLHRICKLVVLLCFLHISVTLFFYVRSLDIPSAFVQNQQQNRVNRTENNLIRSSKLPSVAGEKELEKPGEKELEKPGEKELEKCPETSPLLVGPLRVDFGSPVGEELVRQQNPALQPGGRFRPGDCVALQKVAVIIPFRRREEHLRFWLYYLHPILQRQQLDYGVYVVAQDGDATFNRAKLLNVGYTEALKDYDYDCFVFSDVDLIPMDDRNTYRCFSQPRHLSVSMDKFGFRLPYNQYFGGDDDIFNRLSFRGMSISRPSGDIGKCRMIQHQRDKKNEPNPQRFNRIAHTRDTMSSDGISSLSYSLLKTEKRDLYTWISVDVGKP